MSSTPAKSVNSSAHANIAAAAAATGFQLVTSDGQSLDPEHNCENEKEQDTEAVSSVPKMSVEEILNAAGDLAALPHVVMRLIHMTGDPTVTASDLEKIILADQAVAARVLSLANSAYFGLPRKVFFVREAVVFLGFKTVRNLAMTVTAMNMFLGLPDQLSIARGLLWHHSFDVAMGARLIAEHLHKSERADISSEEAFTAGLLHDIGKLVLDLALPDRYMTAVRLINKRGVRFRDIEDKLFPFGHAAVGAALAKRWKLPPSLSDAIAHHHDPQTAYTSPQLVATVALANEIADYLDKIVDGPEQIAQTAPALYSPSCERLGLRAEELPGLILSCQTDMEKSLTLHNCV